MSLIGRAVILPKGYPVGAGKLREDTPGVLEAVDTASDGTEFYRVRFVGRKGKERTTYYSPKRDRDVKLL